MKIIDLHQDISSSGSYLELRIQTDFTQLEKVNTKIVFATGFTAPDEKLIDTIERDFSFYEEWCIRNTKWKIIKTKEDLEGILTDSNAGGIIFHIEGFPDFIGDWNLLEKWYQRGLRSAGLVWNDDNSLGGGTNSNLGLTKLGLEFIRWCEDRGILIDLAHANRVMFKDILAVTKKPLFISHGGLESVVSNRRNFTDQQLKEVISRGGIFGIYFARSSMASGGEFTIADIVKHTRSAVLLLGENAVALGTDFGGMMSGTPDGLSSMSNIENLWRALRDEGFTEEQIEKIAFKNAQRFLKENFS